MDTNIAASLARQLMNDHGLGHWIFEFDRAKCRAGCCKHRSQTISLSYVYAARNTASEVKDTILHEIAHALAGPRHGHDNYWKTICRRIGAKPVRCYSVDIVDMPKGRWKAQCNSCKKEFHRHRRPKYNGCTHCRSCGPVQGSLTYTA